MLRVKLCHNLVSSEMPATINPGREPRKTTFSELWEHFICSTQFMFFELPLLEGGGSFISKMPPWFDAKAKRQLPSWHSHPANAAHGWENVAKFHGDRSSLTSNSLKIDGRLVWVPEERENPWGKQKTKPSGQDHSATRVQVSTLTWKR